MSEKNDRPAFEHLRVQMLFPCAAKCRWCRTYLKNGEFARLHKSGMAEQVHEFYLTLMKRYRPQTLYVSGGEALLLPGFVQFVNNALRYCGHVFVYTSYQYPAHVLERLTEEWADLPADRVTLVHSCIHFLPHRWHELTRGFPHDLYVANLRRANALPFGKIVKFVVNHDDSAKEIEAFLQAVEPGAQFRLCFKLLNDQNNGWGAPRMQATRERVRALLAPYAQAANANDDNPPSALPLLNPAVAGAVARGDVLSTCPYRSGPKELRFSFYRARNETVTLKARFCPYFGPNTFHKFVVGETPLAKIDKWFASGEYRDKCDSCRLLYYDAGTAASKPVYRVVLPMAAQTALQ